MDDPSIKIHQRVSCRVPENGIEPVRGVILPIPNLVLPIITREKALEAFKAYVNGNCCWDHSFLRNLEVETVDIFALFHVVRDALLLQDRPGQPLRGPLRLLGRDVPRRRLALLARLGGSSVALVAPIRLQRSVFGGRAESAASLHRGHEGV